VIVWIDEQLSHALAPWLAARFSVQAHSVDELGFSQADDTAIFQAARAVGAVVMTKDSDFADLVYRLGPPPQILLIAVGNSRNSRLREILAETFPAALDLLRSGEPLVQIAEPRSGPRL
jgi:predicted nuclease of predicted toxin-antitoxin system